MEGAGGDEKIGKQVNEMHQQWTAWQHRDDMDIKKYIALKNGPNFPHKRVVELLQILCQNANIVPKCPIKIEFIRQH